MGAMGLSVERLRPGLRGDDLIAQREAVRAGMGMGFMAEHVLRIDPQVAALGG